MSSPTMLAPASPSQGQADFVQVFSSALEKRIAANGTCCTPLFVHIRDLLADHEQWKTNGSEAQDMPDRGRWGKISYARKGHAGLRFVITGPGRLDRFEVEAIDTSDADRIITEVHVADEICQAMDEIESLQTTIGLQKAEIHSVTTRMRQLPDQTVKDHIRLLGQYNDIKDIGQQLIGLIAENSRIPVGSLYTDGDYGVGPDD